VLAGLLKINHSHLQLQGGKHKPTTQAPQPSTRFRKFSAFRGSKIHYPRFQHPQQIFTHLKLRILPTTLYHLSVLQIVFNEISAGEISRLETLEQLELLDAFKVTQDTLQDIDGESFGKIERGGTSLFRFRAGDYRVYFEVVDENVIVHRVLHKNTFSDLLFRTKLPVGEDEELSNSRHFWNLIEEGKNAQRL